MSNLHTVSIELQKHYWEWKSKSIDQNCCSRSINYQQHESNHHKLRQKANLQKDESTMIKDLKKQYQKEKSVLKEHIECESKSYFYFFIKCMQSMTMTLSKCCMYAKLHVIWSKSLLYIFSLINHIDNLCIQALSLKLSQSYFRFSSFLRILHVLLFRF